MIQPFENTEENRAELHAILLGSIVHIKFTKRDGSVRKMQGSLREDLVSYEPKGGRERSPAVQTIWDVDANAWRSFRWDSLISYEA